MTVVGRTGRSRIEFVMTQGLGPSGVRCRSLRRDMRPRDRRTMRAGANGDSAETDQPTARPDRPPAWGLRQSPARLDRGDERVMGLEREELAGDDVIEDRRAKP